MSNEQTAGQRLMLLGRKLPSIALAMKKDFVFLQHSARETLCWPSGLKTTCGTEVR